MNKTASILLLSAFGFGLSATQETCGTTDSPSTLKVGAASVSILPEVAGSTSYFDPIRTLGILDLAPGSEGRDPGVFVEEWDVGTIPIGNGARSSHWVHDDVRATAIAFQDLNHPEAKTLVLVSVDVYMLFRQDLEEVYDKVKQRVGATAYDTLSIVISATHNHMGPDTSGMSGMNHEYYRYMTDRVADAVVIAIDANNLAPAKLKVARSAYQFGMADSHAPYIADPTLHSIQAVSVGEETERVLATLVQWQNHPEDTCFYGEDIYADETQAAYLRSVGECVSDDNEATCNVEGQFISGGFAGIAMQKLMEDTAAPAAYFNGPVGVLLAPLHAYVWETEGASGVPAGDGLVVPQSAVILPQSFHSQAVNGNELAKRVLSDLTLAEEVIDPPVTWNKHEFYGRISNAAFRLGMSLRPNGQPILLGHLKRDMFTCPESGVRDDTTCISDNYESASDPLLNVPVRIGTFGKTETWKIGIGPIGIVTAPAEIAAELANGLPSDFRADPRNEYYKDASNKINHADNASYHLYGYVRQAIPESYKLIFGLTMDELGYMVPLSEWRISCVADADVLGGAAGNCAALYTAGIMTYQSADGNNYSISGQTCRAIYANPAILQSAPYTSFPQGGDWAYWTCYYGQALGEADGHYEETLSASWDLEQEYLEAVRGVTGYAYGWQEINPDFISTNLRAP